MDIGNNVVQWNSGSDNVKQYNGDNWSLTFSGMQFDNSLAPAPSEPVASSEVHACSVNTVNPVYLAITKAPTEQEYLDANVEPKRSILAIKLNKLYRDLYKSLIEYVEEYVDSDNVLDSDVHQQITASVEFLILSTSPTSHNLQNSISESQQEFDSQSYANLLKHYELGALAFMHNINSINGIINISDELVQQCEAIIDVALCEIDETRNGLLSASREDAIGTIKDLPSANASTNSQALANIDKLHDELQELVKQVYDFGANGLDDGVVAQIATMREQIDMMLQQIESKQVISFNVRELLSSLLKFWQLPWIIIDMIFNKSVKQRLLNVVNLLDEFGDYAASATASEIREAMLGIRNSGNKLNSRKGAKFSSAKVETRATSSKRHSSRQQQSNTSEDRAEHATQSAEQNDYHADPVDAVSSLTL